MLKNVEHSHDNYVDRLRPDPDNRNSLRISTPDRNLENIVIANNSISWGIDQLLNVYANDVTFYNNMFTQALYDSLHSKGRHSMGPLLRNSGSQEANVSMIGNLFAHNNARNPLSRAHGLVFVNNLLYNWGNKATDLQGDRGQITLNSLVGNYYKAGQDSSTRAIVMRGSGSSNDMSSGSKVYVEDNITPSFDGSDPWSAVDIGSALNSTYKATTPPIWNKGLNVLPASDAYEWVLKQAGARPADRDNVDNRIIKDVRNGTGRIIDRTLDVGGWPTLAVNRTSLAIPANPNSDKDGDGYTNIEEWLHQMAAKVEGQQAPDLEIAPPSAPRGLLVH